MRITILFSFFVVLCLTINKACHGSRDGKSNRTIVEKSVPYPPHPLLFQDVKLVEKLSHFVREKTINRRTFSTGTGAFGYFECTLPNAGRYSKAKLFNKVGKRTPIVVRIAPGSSRLGAPQPIHNDLYGFCIRFYTEEGNFDLLMLSFPLSPLRNTMRSPDLSHANEENPVNNLKDPNGSIDFVTSNLEGLHSFLWQYSDIAVPLTWKVMTSYSLSSLSFTNEKGKIYHVRFTLKAKRKYKYMDDEMAHFMRSNIPDYYMRDLYTSIEHGDYPEYNLIAQILTPEVMKKIDFDPFDPSKRWDDKIFPEIKLGKIVLDRNPKNAFSQIEQIALNPSNLVPGIGSTPDKFQQSRFFIYKDTQLARLGPNHRNFEINKPLYGRENPTIRDGACSSAKNGGSGPNYYPNSFTTIETESNEDKEPYIGGDFIVRLKHKKSDNYKQINETWNAFSEPEQNRIVQRMTADLAIVEEHLQIRLLEQLRIVDPGYCGKVWKNLELKVNPCISK
ncbi:vegetative catalase-like [Brevipalpus obovatus]|uniref:vegetative catalase-like n=1 Tax=Brevipalpus obovatus TaxID=246614 RepID=UPI003D9EC934